MISLRKSLILVHRYLGIVLSAFFVMWFATGIGMIYSRGMPRLTAETRLARLSPLNLDDVHLTPLQAAERLELDSPGRAVLLTVLDRPAYRFGNSDTVFADNGEILTPLDSEQAKAVARRFSGVPQNKIQFAGEVDKPDQWTLTQTRLMPLYKMAVDDGSGTELYVSPTQAEVVQMTTRASRALAWVSTIPHFMYFTALRMNTGLWQAVMTWIPAIGVVLAVVGIVLGIVQFRRSRLPYSGLMRWHYVSGLVFGVLTLTWVFSGLLSMEPWSWTEKDEVGRGLRQALTGGRLDLSEFRNMHPQAWARALNGVVAKEIEFAKIMGEPYYVVRSGPDRKAEVGWPDGGHQPYFVARDPDRHRLVVSAKSLETHDPFDASSILASLKTVKPAAVLESKLLTDYDAYYYSRDGQAPLPVVRVKFDDEDKTWLYVDPEVAEVVGHIHWINRAERWLYNGFHSLDFGFWYYRRPLWDVGVILLSLGGLALSGIGLYMGIRRVGRAVLQQSN